MDTIDCDNLRTSDNFIIAKDISNPESYDSIGNYMLEKTINEDLDLTIYSIGLDNYLMSIGRFNAEKYRFHLNKYHRQYKNGQIRIDNNVLIRAYEYIKDVLNKQGLFYVDDDNQVYEVEEESTAVAISRIIKNSADIIDTDKYKFVIGFADYVILNENKKVLGGK